MNSEAVRRIDAHKIQQIIKWVVYSLLLINFAFYIYEDWNRALHTLDASSTFFDWTAEFATSIDESGWFILLLMLELETYVLTDRQLKGWVSHLIRGVRMLCIVMIAHTVVAFTNTVIDYEKTTPVANVSSLCEMIDADVSYVYNLEYTEVTADTCDTLSDATRYYWLGVDPLVTDREGLEIERGLAWSDLIEVVLWILILLSIEIMVRMQDREITGGALFRALNGLKVLMYGALLAIGVYWASLSHWLYFWDELVWIGGFAAIEMNVSEWRHEIIDEQAGVA